MDGTDFAHNSNIPQFNIALAVRKNNITREIFELFKGILYPPQAG